MTRSTKTLTESFGDGTSILWLADIMGVQLSDEEHAEVLYHTSFSWMEKHNAAFGVDHVISLGDDTIVIGTSEANGGITGTRPWAMAGERVK